MKKQFRQAFNKLQKMGVPVFERSDEPGRFLISAERAESYLWVDSYNCSMRRFGGETVHPEITDVLSDNGLYAEWENAGCLIVYEA